MQTRILLFIWLGLPMIFSCASNGSDPGQLNLGFEQVDKQSHKLTGWILEKSQDIRLGPDEKIAHGGKRSLQFTNLNKFPLQGQAYNATCFLKGIHASKRIRLSGFIRTENTNTDSLGLFVLYYTKDSFGQQYTRGNELRGTHDWAKFSIDLPLKDMANQIIIGAYLYGDGSIWVDDLELTIDGKMISRLPYDGYPETEKQKRWLRQQVVALKSVSAGNGFEDLQALKKSIGNARIVGLGENTHGSSEVFKMKHRLVEFLATEMGFTIFSIEASMPEAYKLNDYVLEGKGDPRKLLKGMYFWTWNTQEVLDMIEWMRNFNANGRGRIEFTGFDMQFYQVAVENIKQDTHAYAPGLERGINSLEATCKGISRDWNELHMQGKRFERLNEDCRQFSDRLKKDSSAIIARAGKYRYEWLLQNAELLIQFSQQLYQPNNYSYRDKCMADNISWILDHNPHAKIILWAHNLHIRKENKAMGGYLARRYKSDYYNLGFLSNSGTYTTFNRRILSSGNVLELSKPGSFEYAFHTTGVPILFFDFSRIDTVLPVSKWLLEEHDFRNCGAVAMEPQFMPATLSRLFNSIIYIEHTHPSQCFDLMPAQAGLQYRDKPIALHLSGMNMLFEGFRQKGSMVIVHSSVLGSMNLRAIGGLTSFANSKGKID